MLFRSDKVIENNRVSIIGEIVSEFKFSHEVFGEGFYTVDVSVDRLSELTDVIPLMVSERLVDVSEDYQMCIRDRNIALNEALKGLSERERKIIDMRFFNGKTQMEIADEIGISQAQVSRLEKNALKAMKKYME